MTGALTLRDYILAGSSVFTIASKKTGKRFTYRVRQQWEGVHVAKSLHVVGVLVNPDNTQDYQFLGTIFDQERYRHGKKSHLSPDAPSARAFDWFWRHVDHLDDLPLAFHKSASCCRCGRLLTTPESIKRGIGPECAVKIGLVEPLRGGQHAPAPSSQEVA